MPLQNRVDPWGVLFADGARGTFMGNRGGALHDDQRRIVRDQSSRRWIICVTEFKGRQRPVMSPGRYTELFFLDEATALAAGHRPCFECRRPDATRFLDLWRRTAGPDAALGELDAAHNDERRVPRSPPGTGKRTYRDHLGRLPGGTMVDLDGDAWLIDGSRLRRWTPGAYTDVAPLDPHQPAWVLTPATTVSILRAGYAPALHPTATGERVNHTR